MSKSFMSIATLSAVLASAALAGPLNPPNGPITSTYKTLTEVEPRIAINDENTPGDADSMYRITLPGSYYLTGLVTATSGKHGIQIDTTNVTIDLGGYRVGGQGGSLDGITMGATTGITIRNGVIYLMNGHGINGGAAQGLRLEGLTVRNCDGQGLVVGAGSEVIRCITQDNGSHGINATDDCIITDCIARNNAGYGIDVDDNSVITGCTATGNQQKGIGANVGVTISGCSSYNNTQEGFLANDWCVVRDCIARNNGLAGFSLHQQPNATRCTSVGNGGAGFDLVFGGTIEGCNASFNGLNGIRVKGDNGANAVLLLNNVCSSNVNSTGIYIEAASAVRIEGNHCNWNGSRGIHVTYADNVIVKNSCRGNTGGNYQFVANNDYGVILTDPGAGFNSSAAWANFAY